MTSFEKIAEIWHDTSDLWSYSCYRIDLGIVPHIFKDENQRIFVAFLTVDLRIQGQALSSRDLPYLRLVGSCYQRDLGVYFHIFEVQDNDNNNKNNNNNI